MFSVVISSMSILLQPEDGNFGLSLEPARVGIRPGSVSGYLRAWYKSISWVWVPSSAYSNKFAGIFSCALIDLPEARERELATLDEKSTSSGIAEPYTRWKLKARTGGREWTTPVTTACPEAGRQKCEKTTKNNNNESYSKTNFWQTDDFGSRSLAIQKKILSKNVLPMNSFAGEGHDIVGNLFGARNDRGCAFPPLKSVFGMAEAPFTQNRSKFNIFLLKNVSLRTYNCNRTWEYQWSSTFHLFPFKSSFYLRRHKSSASEEPQ